MRPSCADVVLDPEGLLLPAPPAIDMRLIKDVLQLKLHGGPLFAMYLRTNARTLENLEQGRAKSNA